MRAERLAVDGAWVFLPDVHADARGSFATPMQGAAVAEALGEQLFPVRQVSCSVSAAGVLRGLHYTRPPGSMAKFAWCARGRATDVVVDLRIGSPTFGRHDVVELGNGGLTAVYLPAGVGHLFLAHEDDTHMTYLMSAEYVAELEAAIDPFDRELALPLPDRSDVVMSDRDAVAGSLADARVSGA